jgi:hypothetical protein
LKEDADTIRDTINKIARSAVAIITRTTGPPR